MAMPVFVQKSSSNQSVNYFSEGIRKGASIQVMPVYNLQPSEAQSREWRNPGSGLGQGTIEGSLITYRITPCKGDIDYTSNAYTIASTGIFTLPFELPLNGGNATVNFYNNITTDRAVQTVTLNGVETGILFDVPRGIGMVVGNLTANEKTTVTAKLTGLDFHKNPLVAQIVYSTNEDGLASPWANNDSEGLAVAYTKSTFSMLTEPPQITWEGVGQPTVQFFAANFFGLPYYLASAGHVSQYSQFSNQKQQLLNETGQTVNDFDSLNEQSSYQATYASVYGPGAAYANINYLPNYTSVPYFMTAHFDAGNDPHFINYGLIPGYDINSPTPPDINAVDVRGIFAPNCQWQQVYAPNTFNVSFSTGDTFGFNGSITIQYYCAGIDFLQNVQKNAIQVYNVDETTWVGFGKSNLGDLNPTQIPTLSASLGVIPYSGN